MGVSTFYGTLEAKGRRENGVGVESSIGLVYTSWCTRKPIPCSKKLQEHSLREQFRTSKLLSYEKKGIYNKSML
jgi:hypothetical protein